MKKLLPLLVAVSLLYGCTSTKKYTSFITEVYKNADTSTAYTNPTVTVGSMRAFAFDSIARVAKGQSYCIPAIVYWGVKESFNCELNPRIPMHIFTHTLSRYADSLGLDKKLNGRRLEIWVNTLPSQFYYVNKEDVIFLGLFAVTIAKQSVAPNGTNLMVTYKLYDKEVMVKAGRIAVLNNDKPFTNNWKSTRKVTRAYLAQYEQNMTALSKEFLVKLVAAL